MNKIDRVLVKSQARQLIKNKVFALFIIAVIAVFLTSISTYVGTYDGVNTFGNLDDYSYSNGNDSGNSDPYSYYFGDGSQSGSDNSSDNPIENFGSNSNGGVITSPASVKSNSASVFRLGKVSASALSIISIILSPLMVTLMGFFAVFVTKNPDEELQLGTEIKNLFAHSFDATYLKKLVIYVLRGLFALLWALLFIIPGIVYNYSSYFAFQIMCEYPSLKPTEALALSKKMVKGNRNELFVLDLSFIGWYLLCAVTFGIASIYVMPYVFTTQALYYQNFKCRALAEGRLHEDDFLSAEEKFAKYSNPNVNPYGGQYNPYGGNPSGAQNAQYNYNPQQQAQSYYYTPPQSQPQNEAPNQQYYTPPQENTQQNSSAYPPYSNSENPYNPAPAQPSEPTPPAQSAPQAEQTEYYQPPQAKPEPISPQPPQEETPSQEETENTSD